MPRLRRWICGGLGLLALATMILLAVRFSAQGIRIVLTPSQLQGACARFFPVTRRYLDLIDFTYQVPAITISAGDDRVHLVVPVRATIAGHALHGSVAGSACLRYDAQAGAIFLDRLLVERASIDQVSPQLLARMVPYALQLLEQHLQTHPIYVLQGTPAREFEHLVIRRLQISQGDLVLTLGR